MRIAVVSDTHLTTPSDWLERAYEHHLAQADMLIHCGDMTGRAAWSYLMRHPDFRCVQGNMDDWSLAEELPPRLDMTIEGLTVTVCHGWGYKAGLSRRLYEAFGPDYDIIFFGHTHAREDSQYGTTRCINPGSLREGSLAIVTIENGKIATEFVSL